MRAVHRAVRRSSAESSGPRIDIGSNNRMQNQAESNVVLKTRKDDTENRLYRPESVFAYNRYGCGGEASASPRGLRDYIIARPIRGNKMQICATTCNNMQTHAKGQRLELVFLHSAADCF